MYFVVEFIVDMAILRFGSCFFLLIQHVIALLIFKTALAIFLSSSSPIIFAYVPPLHNFYSRFCSRSIIRQLALGSFFHHRYWVEDPFQYHSSFLIDFQQYQRFLRYRQIIMINSSEL